MSVFAHAPDWSWASHHCAECGYRTTRVYSVEESRALTRRAWCGLGWLTARAREQQAHVRRTLASELVRVGCPHVVSK